MLKKILVILACGLPIFCAGVAAAAEPAAGNPVVTHGNQPGECETGTLH